MIAALDTTREITETAKELKDRGVIKGTATAVKETAAEAREIGESAIQQAQVYGTSVWSTRTATDSLQCK